MRSPRGRARVADSGAGGGAVSDPSGIEMKSVAVELGDATVWLINQFVAILRGYFESTLRVFDGKICRLMVLGSAPFILPVRADAAGDSDALPGSARFYRPTERLGELKRIRVGVDPHLEMTEICDRCCGPVGRRCCSKIPKGHAIPVLGNLFGTPRRVALGMGADDVEALREVGKLLAFLKGTGPAQGNARCLGEIADLQEGAGHGAEEGQSATLSGTGDRSGRRGLGAAAGAALLAGGCRTVDHLGSGGDLRAEQVAPESGDLPPAGDRAE